MTFTITSGQSTVDTLMSDLRETTRQVTEAKGGPTIVGSTLSDSMVGIELGSRSASEAIDPNVTAENAAHATHQHLLMAHHIRKMVDDMGLVYETLRATGYKLADDIEAGVKGFESAVIGFRSHAEEKTALFEEHAQKVSTMLSLMTNGRSG